MGFPSPAMDYVERQLSPVVLCHIKPESRVLETDTGYAVIEPATKKTPGDVLLGPNNSISKAREYSITGCEYHRTLLLENNLLNIRYNWFVIHKKCCVVIF